MSCHDENVLDGTTLEFPRAGFWAMHMIGAGLLFGLGMRYASRHEPLPFRLVRMLMSR